MTKPHLATAPSRVEVPALGAASLNCEANHLKVAPTFKPMETHSESMVSEDIGLDENPSSMSGPSHGWRNMVQSDPFVLLPQPRHEVFTPQAQIHPQTVLSDTVPVTAAPSNVQQPIPRLVARKRLAQRFLDDSSSGDEGYLFTRPSCIREDKATTQRYDRQKTKPRRPLPPPPEIPILPTSREASSGG